MNDEAYFSRPSSWCASLGHGSSAVQQKEEMNCHTAPAENRSRRRHWLLDLVRRGGQGHAPHFTGELAASRRARSTATELWCCCIVLVARAPSDTIAIAAAVFVRPHSAPYSCGHLAAAAAAPDRRVARGGGQWPATTGEWIPPDAERRCWLRPPCGRRWRCHTSKDRAGVPAVLCSRFARRREAVASRFRRSAALQPRLVASTGRCALSPAATYQVFADLTARAFTELGNSGSD
jgi:hypothetical protein